MANLLGLYEKALPAEYDWRTRLETVRRLGFEFMEISIDESDERLERLYWSKRDRARLVEVTRDAGIPIMTMCLSGHRRFPLGSHDEGVREKSLEIMRRAIDFAVDTGIRVIQLAGYDVYYEESDRHTRRWFLEGLGKCARMAEKHQVMLALETMDTPFMKSVRDCVEYCELVGSPWLSVYPDIGNLSAWGLDMDAELEVAAGRMVAVHVKDTLAVRPDFPGRFRGVPFGEGCVEFARVFARMKSMEYAGPFVVEMWADQSPEPVEAVARAREWVQARLTEGGF